MRYLIVEEDLCGREFLRDLLIEEAACDMAFGGLQAIDMYRQAVQRGMPYDAVIADSELPDLPGSAIQSAIRTWERQHGILAERATKVVLLVAPWRRGQHRTEGNDPLSACVPRPAPYDADQVRSALRALWRAVPSCAADHAGVDDPARAQRADALAGGAAQPAACGDRRGRGARRFLIVDHDRLSRELLLEILAEFGQCQAVTSGQEALRVVRDALADGAPLDLVTIDVRLDDIDGHVLLARLRELEYEHGVVGAAAAKVIMTTTFCDSDHCMTTTREDREGYVTKPIHDLQLRHKLLELGVIEPQAVFAH